MSDTQIFFNTEGYPYNFEYDSRTDAYTGTLYFDENSSDTFKTLGLYVFDRVDPIKFNTDLIASEFSLFDLSGISFRPFTYTTQPITNITRVNPDPNFYSKWIYGAQFDVKFPIGTLITLSGVQFTSPNLSLDFTKSYYQVIDNRPGGILIMTDLPNQGFTGGTYLSGGTVASHNSIVFNDYTDGPWAKSKYYDYQNYLQAKYYSNTLEPYVSPLTGHSLQVVSPNGNEVLYLNEVNCITWHSNLVTNLRIEISYNNGGSWSLLVASTPAATGFYYFKPLISTSTGKIRLTDTTTPSVFGVSTTNFMIVNTAPLYSIKTSIVGSDANDQVTDITRVTLAESYFQNYTLVGTTGDTLTLEVELFTERPKIYQGPVTFVLSGTSANLILQRPLNSLLTLGENQQIIFETYDDQAIAPGNPIFTINDGILEDDVYMGLINFIQVENQNATKYKNFTNKSLSSLNFTRGIASAQALFPARMRVYDYFLEFPGDTTELQSDLRAGHHIQVSATTLVPGATLHDQRSYTVEQLISFRDYRLRYYAELINNDPNWFAVVVDKAIANQVPVDQQVQTDAEGMYNNYDVPAIAAGTLSPLTLIQVREYVIPETGYSYNIKRVFEAHDIRNLECTSSQNYSPVTFTTNAIGYSTTNKFTVSQQLSGTYQHSIDLFNNQHGAYLQQLGINVAYRSGTTEELIVDSGDITFSSRPFFKTRAWVNNVFLVSGNTDHLMPVLILETSGQLVREAVVNSDTGNTAHNYHGEILLDLVDNFTSTNGFTIIINDVEFFSYFTGDTATSIHLFVATYQSTFQRQGLSLSSGSSTLYLDGLSPDIHVHSTAAKVNAFSTATITTRLNKGIIIDATCFNAADVNFYDLQLSTGMIIGVSGSSYPQNNREYNIIGLNPHSVDLSYQGPFFADSSHPYQVTTRQYLRKPRGTYGKDIYYNFRFGEPNTPAMFFYDLSGEHLTPYLDQEALRYTGPTPLWDTENVCSTLNENLFLQDEPNKDPLLIADPTKQQTVWRGLNDNQYALKFKLDRLDSMTYYNYVPEPLQVFLGFNSESEGVFQTTVYMDQVENVLFSGLTDTNTQFTFTSTGLLTIQTNVFNFDWRHYGFAPGQTISIDFIDQAFTGTTIFANAGPYTIGTLNREKLHLSGVSALIPFNTSAGTYLYQVQVQPKRRLTLNLMGESEIEDERFRIGLRNLGLDLNFDDEAIFRESDINEDGIDYILLNRKRKELLSIYPEIYNYIGSYKALINAINLFGYNELQVYEYYRNIDPFSPLYQKLHKVLIPDIFDNSVVGFNPQNYIKEKYQKSPDKKNKMYKKTNLFNLTYEITDHEGNNVQLFSLDEVQYKLTRLKRWLKRNIIPLSANIIDITGVAESTAQMYQNYDVSNQSLKCSLAENTLGINFNISVTQNMESNYLLEVRFYTHSNLMPENGWSCKIQTFSRDNNNVIYNGINPTGSNRLIPQQYHKLFKTEWSDFSTSLDLVLDEFLFIETCYYNERGSGVVFNKMIHTSTARNYLLVNNQFAIPRYNYLNTDQGYYFFDKDGYLYFQD